MATVQAGIAETLITPPAGADLAGYARREGPAQGLHDELFCRALVLDDGGTRLACVTLDLVGFDFSLAESLRQAAGNAGALPPGNVLVNCSHTHAGPATKGLEGTGRPNHAYVSALPGLILETVSAAAGHLAPAALSYAEGPARAGINRRVRTAEGLMTIGRNPSGLSDGTVRTLLVETDRAGQAAVMFHHACHGTALSHENRLISADWMGAAVRRLRSLLGERYLPIFLQGCAGQINPDVAEHSFEEADRVGAEMAASVMGLIGQAQPIQPTPLAARIISVGLPQQDPPSPVVARADLAAAEAGVEAAKQQSMSAYRARALETLVTHARNVLALSEAGARGQTLPFSIQALRLGDLAIIGLSGEVFLEFAREIEAKSPFQHTLVLGYSNGCACYVPTAEALAEGGYEAADSFRWYGILPLRPEAGEVMVAAAVRLLHELHDQQSAR